MHPRYRVDVGYVGHPAPVIEHAWRRFDNLDDAINGANQRVLAERLFILRHDSNAGIKIEGSWRRDRAKCISYTPSPAKHPRFVYAPVWVAIRTGDE